MAILSDGVRTRHVILPGGTGQEETSLQQRPIPYQVALRRIGRFLDDARAWRVQVLESRHEFIIRFQRNPDDLGMEVMSVAFEELTSLSGEIEHKRRRGTFESEGSAGYENIFRLLGRDFDGLQAYNLLIDEIEDGFFVTYHYLDPARSFTPRKRMATIEHAAVHEALLEIRASRSG